VCCSLRRNESPYTSTTSTAGHDHERPPSWPAHLDRVVLHSGTTLPRHRVCCSVSNSAERSSHAAIVACGVAPVCSHSHGAVMQNAHSFLQNLALVFCVAALTTIVFHRLRQPVVFGYLLAGMIVGPHLPVPLVADEATIRTLSELGVILLMFSLGLEFRLRRVVAIAGTSGLAALAETSLMLGVGFVAARALGWTPIESVFTGAMVAISSTTIVAKAFAELKVTGRVREIVFGETAMYVSMFGIPVETNAV